MHMVECVCVCACLRGKKRVGKVECVCVCACLRGKKRVGNGVCPLTRRVEANVQSILLGHLCTINPLA